MNLNEILHYIHYLVPISILLMPFLPSPILLYIFPYPVVYYFIWFFCDGCPLTKWTHNHSSHIPDNKNFTQNIIHEMGIQWSNKQINRFVGLVMMLSVIISAYKVIFYYKGFKE